MFIPFMYMVLLPFGERLGSEDCMDFINSTVCIVHSLNGQDLPPGVLIEPVYYGMMISSGSSGCQRGAPWHLPRLNSADKKSGEYDYDEDGSGVDVYALDTWVDCDHVNFQDRCRELKRFARHDESARPTHGTHVAGLAASWSFSAGKRVQLKSVVVLDDDGVGDYASFIKALEFVKTQILRRGANRRRAIVNMSLKGGKSRILDKIVEELHVENVAVMVIAAGNDNADACEYSPQSSKIAIVGATDVQNRMSTFSNYGTCVNMLAPGESIQSLCPDQKQCWQSGTSMASPVVAGAIAAFWDARASLNTVQVWQNFRDMAARGKIQKVKGLTPNVFARIPVRGKYCSSEEVFIQVSSDLQRVGGSDCIGNWFFDSA